MWIILAVTICFIFAYIKDAQAMAQLGELKGLIHGKRWSLKTAVLKKRLNSKFPKVILEFYDRQLSEVEICNENLSASMTFEIPIVTSELSTVIPDYDNMSIHTGPLDKSAGLACYHTLELKAQELNTNGLLYVDGSLELSSRKERTELSGNFRARVCN